jgi:proline dehydrogenase
MTELLLQLALTGDVQSIALDVVVPGLRVRAEISGERDTNDAAILLAEASFEIANLASRKELGEKAVAVAGFDIKAENAD